MFYNKTYKITSPYGIRTLNGKTENHKGVDIVGIDDKTILSPIDGIVQSSTIISDKSNLTWQWGNYIRIDSTDGFRLFFCHLSKRLVKKGDKVKKGQPIGIEGNTGYSFGIHLHFEVRNSKNISINPIEYMKKDSKMKGIDVADNKSKK